MKPPCPPHCTLRRPGCQGKCPKIAEYRAKIDAMNEVKAKERLLDGYTADTVRRNKNNMSRTKGALKLNCIR